MAQKINRGKWDGSASRFSDEQYARSCLIDRGGDSPTKERCSLPVREPDGTPNLSGMRSAAAALVGGRGGVSGVSDAEKKKAAKTLANLFKSVGEDIPEGLEDLSGVRDSDAEDKTETSERNVYQTPYDFSPLSRLSRHIVRKQILPLGSINYVDKTGRSQKVNFSPEVIKGIIKSAREKPFDFIPLKLATESNGHNDDVLKTVGEIKDFEENPNGGLDIIGELDDDGVKAVQKSDGKLGISARFHDNYFRDHDARAFGSAISHGLLCDRPYVTGMGPWQPVEMSEEEEVVDLTAQEWTEEPEVPEEEVQTGLELSDEDRAVIQEVIQEMALQDTTGEVDMASDSTSSFKQGDKVSFNRFGKQMSGTVQSVDTSGSSAVASVKLSDGSTVKVPVSTLKGGDEKNMSEGSEEYRELAENNRRNEVELAELRATLKQSEVEKKAERAFAKGATKHQVETYLVPLWMAEAGEQTLGSFDLSAPDGDLSVQSKEGSVSLSALGDALLKEFAGSVEVGERGVTPKEDETKDLSLGDFNTRVSDYMKEHGVQGREAIRAVGNQHVAQRAAQG